MLTQRNKGQPEKKKFVFPWEWCNDTKSSHWQHLPIYSFNLCISQLPKYGFSLCSYQCGPLTLNPIQNWRLWLEISFTCHLALWSTAKTHPRLFLWCWGQCVGNYCNMMETAQVLVPQRWIWSKHHQLLAVMLLDTFLIFTEQQFSFFVKWK